MRLIKKMLPNFVKKLLIRYLIRLPDQFDPRLVIKVADKKDEFDQAFKLVYESYHKLNLIEKSAIGHRVTKYNLGPSTIVLVAKYDDEVIGTVSLIMDSPMGLPSDGKESVQELRKKGLAICEISSLVIKKEWRRNSKEVQGVMFLLCKGLWLLAANYLGADALLATTNRTARVFYEEVLCFKKLNNKSMMTYSFVKDKASASQYLDLKTAAEVYYKKYNKTPDHRNMLKFFWETDHTCLKLENPNLGQAAYMPSENIAGFMNEIARELNEKELKSLSQFYNPKKFQRIFASAKVDERKLFSGEQRFLVQKIGQFKVDDNLVFVKTRSISATGLGFVSTVEVKEGQTLWFNYVLPWGETTKLLIEIIWTEQGSGSHFVGAKILNIDNKSWQIYIRSLVEQTQPVAAAA